jgi:arginyl-tRNA synthetase
LTDAKLDKILRKQTMQIREQLEQIIDAAISKAFAEKGISVDELPKASLERPREQAHGDWASTAGLRSARLLHANPRSIAQTIIDNIADNDLIGNVAIAGAGFINITLKPAALQNVLIEVCTQKEDYGKGKLESGKTLVNLEYVSANPTGPMHVGHGRWAALGDAMARVMRHAGYDVFEEFYINDAGSQMDLFGTSVTCRYLQICGLDVAMIENGYEGSYVVDIAKGIYDRDGQKWVHVDENTRRENFREIAYAEMLHLMKDTLENFGNHFDRWFSERSLYVEDSKGLTPIDKALNAMDEKGYVYKKDGATWFRSTAAGDEKDRVLIKENGEYTYFMSDVAYHFDKLMRGFDHLINIWGADHHGYVKRCEAMLAAWDRPGSLEIVLGQLVNLFRDGQAVRMSKRTGEMVTFSELVEEVGVDSTRYLMLSRSSDQPIDFDIETAKKRDATNPVYYVQYAHARICSILRKAQVSMTPCTPPDLTCLTHESELALMRKMSDYEDLIAKAAADRAPFRLTHYVQELASLFHQFYTNCPVISEDKKLQAARLYLINATRMNLAHTLSLLGVSAPEQM